MSSGLRKGTFRVCVFYALLPLVCTALPVLALANMVFFFMALVALMLPPVGILLIGASLALFIFVGALAWLWVGLVRWPQPARDRTVPASVLVIAGCASALAVLSIVVRHEVQAPSTGQNLFLAIAFIEALVAYVGLGLFLVIFWRVPLLSTKPLRMATLVPTVVLLWLVFATLVAYGNHCIPTWTSAARRDAASRIDSGTAEPVAKYLCLGNLPEAERALRRKDANPDVQTIIDKCIDTNQGTAGRFLFPERLSLSVDATLVAEQRAGIGPSAACTPLRQGLLKKIFLYDAQLLKRIRDSGLPIHCDPLDKRGPPMWWSTILYRSNDESIMADLVLMDSLGIDWSEKWAGVSVLGGPRDALLQHLSHEALLYLLRRTEPSKAEMGDIAVDVLRRKFLLMQSPEDRHIIASLYELVGEPSPEQLKKSRATVSMIFSDELDKRALVSYLMSKLAPHRSSMTSDIDTYRADSQEIVTILTR